MNSKMRRMLAALDLANVQMSQVEKLFEHDEEFKEALVEIRDTIDDVRKHNA